MSKADVRYVIGFQSSIDTPVVCSGDIATGVLFSNYPDFTVDNIILDNEYLRGSSAKHYKLNYRKSVYAYKIPFSIVATPTSLYPILRLFFQRGYHITGDTVWFYPYSYELSGSVCSVWGTVVRKLTDSNADSQRLSGAIIDTLAFDLSDYFLKVTGNFTARRLETDYDSTNDDFTLDTEGSLLKRQVISKIGDSYTALQDFDIESLALNIRNNIKPRYYNNEYIKRYTLGKVTSDGRLRCPRENSSTDYNDDVFLNYAEGTKVVRICVYWDSLYSPTVSISFLAKLVDIEQEIAEGNSNTIVFYAVEDSSFSFFDNKIQEWQVDSSDATIVSLTLATDVVLTGNVFPGDKILMKDSTNSIKLYKISDIIDDNTIKLSEAHIDGTGAGGEQAVIIRQPITIGINKGG